MTVNIFWFLWMINLTESCHVLSGPAFLSVFEIFVGARECHFNCWRQMIWKTHTHRQLICEGCSHQVKAK